MNKRKAEYTLESPPKKQKTFKIWENLQNLKPVNDNIENFVSGTGVKNYLLRDPVLDWFDIYAIKRCNMSPNELQREKKKLNILFEGGLEFEKKVLEHIEHTFSNEMCTINLEGKAGFTLDNYDLTISAMKNGIPIIAQAVLMNDNKTGGIADLLIRSDYINKIFRRQVISDEMECYRAPNLSGNYHYRVIDIKWTSMTLCANGYNIRNDGRFPAYKGQLAIYNCAVGHIQGYTPNEAYIMAKAWKKDSKVNPEQGFSCFDLLGVIDYSDFDNSYIEKTIQSIKWVRDVREHGGSWDLLNPTRDEMYPNACNTFDAPWTKQKKKLCKDLNEITQIWYVTDQHRRNAHKNGIKTWKDPDCNSKVMGVTGEVKPEVIDMILDINRDPKGTIMPQEIDNNFMNWQESGPCDFYVDFETMNCCFYNPEIDIENSKNEADIVFMIGVGYIEDDEWHYDVFTADDITFEEEKKIFDRFTDFIERKSKDLDASGEYIPRLFHWSPAEVTNFKHANERHRDRWVEWQKNIVWMDMYKVFTTEPIVVKGALNFKLKEIGGAMHKLGLISTVWKECGPSDGFSAMLEAVQFYKDKRNGNLTSEQREVYNEIINYNEIDCKVIWDIVKYLRENHSNNDDDFTLI